MCLTKKNNDQINTLIAEKKWADAISELLWCECSEREEKKDCCTERARSLKHLVDEASGEKANLAQAFKSHTLVQFARLMLAGYPQDFLNIMPFFLEDKEFLGQTALGFALGNFVHEYLLDDDERRHLLKAIHKLISIQQSDEVLEEALERLKRSLASRRLRSDGVSIRSPYWPPSSPIYREIMRHLRIARGMLLEKPFNNRREFLRFVLDCRGLEHVKNFEHASIDRQSLDDAEKRSQKQVWTDLAFMLSMLTPSYLSAADFRDANEQFEGYTVAEYERLYSTLEKFELPPEYNQDKLDYLARIRQRAFSLIEGTYTMPGRDLSLQQLRQGLARAVKLSMFGGGRQYGFFARKPEVLRTLEGWLRECDEKMNRVQEPRQSGLVDGEAEAWLWQARGARP